MESTIREERVEGESPRLLRRFDCHHLNHPTPVGTNPATQLVDRVELGNVTKMLTRIEPAVVSWEDFPGQKTSDDPNFLSTVIDQNVLVTISYIRKNSPILEMMEENGDIVIMGAATI